MSSTTLKLLDDWVELNDFAPTKLKSIRAPWAAGPHNPTGLPYAKLGNKKIIHIPTAREWLLGRMHRPNARRAA